MSAGVLLAAQAARDMAIDLALTDRDAPFAGATPGDDNRYFANTE